MSSAAYRKLDWTAIVLYLLLVIFGWMNIYSSSFVEGKAVYDLSTKYGMHLIWIVTALVLAFFILFSIPSRIYPAIAPPLYVVVSFLLIAVAFLGVEVNGSKSWFAIGPFRFQPAEFSKLSTSLLLTHILSQYDFSFRKVNNAVRAGLTVLLPILFILMEKETGSALVYLGFFLVCYREGMNGWILLSGLMAILLFIITMVASPVTAAIVLTAILFLTAALYSSRPAGWLVTGAVVVTGLVFLLRIPEENVITSILMGSIPIAILASAVLAYRREKLGRNLLLGYACGIIMILSVQVIFDKVLQEHQRARIEVLFGIREDPMGVGYNVHQSLIAIGSGGFAGKGYLNGTQTRYGFVPEQSTDFIFCTVGEEWGFLGSILVMGLYLALILHLTSSAEKQDDRFTRIYGYCVACCILMHVVINVSMTIGLMPVIGIPLPFMSYGGSSLWAFTILLFIYLKLDYDRKINR